ncbi:hypothetical protein HBB16_16410 [Pseudonocardia sp. MCCB 268]|nr:hypothetical protein [Pseudonocardia cytotoxica]
MARSGSRLDEDAVRARPLASWPAGEIEAVGICFMNSYRNPEHEQRREDLAEELPRVRPDRAVPGHEGNTSARPSRSTPMRRLRPRRLPELPSLDALAAQRFTARWIMMTNGGVATHEAAGKAPVFQACVRAGRRGHWQYRPGTPVRPPHLRSRWTSAGLAPTWRRSGDAQTS